MKKLVIVTLIIFLLSASVAYAGEMTASIDLAAVKSDGTGVLTNLEVEVVPGKGRVLLTINPFTGISTQDSEKTAVQVAEQETDFDFSKHDVIFTIDAEESSVVDGPSAGSAMAVAVIAAVQGKQVREDAGITGTINSDGTIGRVGGIVEKAVAAAEGGDKVFVIPDGNAIQPKIVEKVEEPAPGWTIKRTTTEYIDISKELEEEHGIKVIEVKTIKDAVNILLEGKNEGVEDEDKIKIDDLDIENLELTDLRAPMKSLAEWQRQDANSAIEEAGEALESQKIGVEERKMLQEFLASAGEEMEKSKSALDKNYLYGSANFAFRATISARYARDVATYYDLEEIEQIRFVGDRITQVTRKVNQVKELITTNQHFAEDSTAFEWGIAAMQRITQAESQLQEKPEQSEGILYSINTVGGWVNIAENFMTIAKEVQSGDLLDIELFVNKSNGSIERAQAEFDLFGEEGQYGANWYLKTAKMEQDREWYSAAFIDAEIAVLRMETTKELEERGWEEIVPYIESELNSVDTSLSSWAELYKDYGMLVLSQATAEKSTGLLEEALTYARQATLFSGLAEEYSNLPLQGFKLEYNLEMAQIGIGILVIFVVLVFMKKGLKQTFSATKRKKK